jgi:hypothetical protein
MKKYLFMIFALLALVFSADALASAVLIDSSGSVTVQAPGGTSTPGVSGMELADGSVISVGGDGSASVMLADGSIDQISTGNTYKVGGPAQTAHKTSLGEGVSIAMNETAQGGEQPTLQGMVRNAKGPSARFRQNMKARGKASGGIEATYPRNTTIVLGSSVTFSWKAKPAVNWPSPAIVIDDGNGKRMGVEKIAEGSRSQKVDTAKLGLKKGETYVWYLATTSGGVKGKSGRFEFRTLSEAKEKQLASKKHQIDSMSMGKDGKKLLTAQLYYNYKLYGKMKEELASIPKENRTSYVKKLLAMANAKMNK